MLRDLYEDSIWGILQLLAAYALTDEDREAHPGLVDPKHTERRFTKSWAESMVRSVEKEGFKKVLIRVILDNPVQAHTHAGFCLGIAHLNGHSPYRIECAANDLRVMLWSYGNGEGPDLPWGHDSSEEDGDVPVADLLVQVGHEREVATLATRFMGSEISSARLRRMTKRSAAKESTTYQNARFRRGEAVLGVRPWVYDGKVDPSKDGESDDVILALLDSLNYKEGDGLEGRWTAFKTAHHG